MSDIEVPDEWRKLGFSGKWAYEVELVEPDGWPRTDKEAEKFGKLLPALLPIGVKQSFWLGLSIRKTDEWLITMVFRDQWDDHEV